MMKKQKVVSILGVVIVIAIIVCISVLKFDSSVEQSGSITVGAVLPLTGELSFFGIPEKYALDLALKKANTELRPLGRQITLSIEDSKSTSKDGVAATQKILLTQPVSIITSLTITSLAAQPIIADAGIPQIALSVHPTISSLSPNVFRLYYGFDDEMKALGNLAVSLGASRIGILWINVPECEIAIEQFLKPALAQSNATIVASSPFNFGTTDFRPLLTPVAAANPDLLIIQDFGNNLQRIIETATILGLDKMVGGIGFLTTNPAGIVAVKGIPFVCPSFVVNQPQQYADFRDSFREISGGLEPSYDAIYTYDAFMLVSQAIGNAGNVTSSAIINALQEGHFAGLGGDVRLSKNRNLETTTIVGMYDEGGKIVAYNY